MRQTVTQVLLDLAAYPEHQDPLKEEIETVLRKFGGWQKQGGIVTGTGKPAGLPKRVVRVRVR
jgi:hypothetical protein